MRKELEQDTGVLLNSVAPASPAEKEGLEVGDIVVKLGGDSILFFNGKIYGFLGPNTSAFVA